MARHLKRVLWMASMGLAGLGSCAPTSLWARAFVYVSLDAENRIATYAIDLPRGNLIRLADAELPSPAGALTVSPNGHYLFASLRSAGRLASFQIDPNRGTLTQLSSVPAGDDPAFVATDQTGRFLLTAYYVAGKVTIHAIGDEGALSDKPLQETHTADKAHAILTDPSNRFAYVPHTGPNAIFCFQFDARQGRLTPNVPGRIDTGENTGPRQFVYHPRLDIVYFDYEQGSAIAAYDRDGATGELRFREQLSTLPSGYAQANSNARIDMTRDGRFIYVANRGHDSLAMFAVDGETGRLTSLGQAKTEATPRGFAIEPKGRFLYAAGQSSGKLAAFQIDPASGKLTRFDTYSVGDQPWWVLIVETEGTDP